MRFIKRSTRATPKVSLILLDWSVRESFHLLHYLGRQSVDRNQFEVAVIEYYAREAEALKPFAGEVDTWTLLEMPESCVYHKHLMYNCGIALCRGEIIVLCDSDAMVKEGFIQTIIDSFARQDRIVLHLDQFRNNRRDFYPFNYPSFEEVLGGGCINNCGGKTAGVLDRVDPLHSRNYGACMCARRADLIAIGGADEHVDYLGHICGPYEMTFRLSNRGLKEVWHETEFLYHTWHPGQAGVDNYQGPHDGRQMSSTALEGFVTKRIRPLVENRAIRYLRTGEELDGGWIGSYLIDERYRRDWNREVVKERQACERQLGKKPVTDLYRGYKITNDDGRYYAWRNADATAAKASREPSSQLILEGDTVADLVQKIDESYPALLRVSERINLAYSRALLVIWPLIAPIVGLFRGLWRNFAKGDRRLQTLHVSSSYPEQSFLRARRGLWQRYKAAWLAARQHRVFMDSWCDHLIATLYFVDNILAISPSGEQPMLLTTSFYTQLYLKILMLLCIIPPFRVVRLKGAERVRYHLESLQKRRARVILGRDIYTQYYGLVKSFPALDDALIF